MTSLLSKVKNVVYKQQVYILFKDTCILSVKAIPERVKVSKNVNDLNSFLAIFDFMKMKRAGNILCL